MKFTFNDKQFKIKNHKVHWNRQQIPLSEKGHACLILFLNSDNQILSKNHLIDTLWEKVVVSDDSLFKVIQEVRKSLKQLGFEGDMIGNVYGKGYQWLPQTKPPQKRLRFVIPMALILVTFLMVFLFSSAQAPRMTQGTFDTLLSQIKSGQQVALNKDQASNEDQHPLDALRYAYLSAYQWYQSGAYDQSIDVLKNGIAAFEDTEVHIVLADSYYLLAKMYIYRDDKKALKTYLTLAEKHYSILENKQGILNTQIETARYHQSIFEYPQSIHQLTAIFEQATARSNTKIQLRALANLAHSYEQTNQHQAAEKALNDTLELALLVSDGHYAAYAYGALATSALAAKNYRKAMNNAQAALQFSLSQHDTNQFQQSFSAFYLLLLPFGHNSNADKYLNLAIQVQNHFNPQGVLFLAEIQRIQSLASQNKHRQSRAHLKNLMTKTLDNSEKQLVQALYAYTSHFLKDNINAYTQAKTIFENKLSPIKARVYAGMAFVLAADHLERTEEAKAAFANLQEIITTDDNISYAAYLDTLNRLPSDWVDQSELDNLTQIFEQKMVRISTATAPKDELLITLDDYIKAITKP